MLKKLESREHRYQELDRLMADPQVAINPDELQRLAKERASLEEMVVKYRDYKSTTRELEDTRRLLEDGLDEEMMALARDELEALEKRRAGLEADIREALTPRDPRDQKDVIIEIRAGAGGEEAALFAGDLYRMYSRYAQSQGFKLDILNTNQTGIGGFKEIIFEARGKGAFSRFKYESGVHRVQRVPVTEAGGRIHTSTATVAVMSEVDDVEVNIKPEDLRIDIFHAGGHGGQNVNKVATAVRITHIPTGMVAVCQDERSQLKNRTKAMAVLRARLYDRKFRKQQEEISQARRSQVGSGDRAEKIRTYNYPQDRVTDHRIGLTLHSLSRLLEGEMDGLVEALAVREREENLEKAYEG
ncbi:MAG: peptide chain release factor 1 [Dehalococcoidia bacterium]